MPRKEAESSTSTRQREALLDSPARVAPLRAGAKYPPPYGAQHRQDALWEGGNEALPPQWHQFQVLVGETKYQDNALAMVSRNRPLPGVRLDEPGQLVIAGCEWHISPLGRSYFVNHDSRTTSWNKPKPVRPAESLVPECIVEGHSRCIWSLACLGTSCNILSASDDWSIRHWKKDGEPVGKPLDSDGGGICSMTLSPDETMVASGSKDGRLRLWNIRKGIMVGDPWEGHNDGVRCLDWSPNSLEIASGSQDGTIRRWNPDTGRQTATPIETGHGWVEAVKYSPQCDKFMSGGMDCIIRVWSKDGQLLIEIKGHDYSVTSLCWSKDGAHIFSASCDHTIRKWRSNDGEELVVLLGHTNNVRSLCLLPDENDLVSASEDCTVRIWDLKTNQLVGDPLLHDDGVVALAISRDRQYIVSGGLEAKVYVWSMEAALNRRGGDQVGSVDDTNAKPDAKSKASQPCSSSLSLSISPFPRGIQSDREITSPHTQFSPHSTRVTKARRNMSVLLFVPELRSLIVSSILTNSIQADATSRQPREASQTAGAPSRRIPPGFFDEIPRHVDSSTSRTHRTLFGRLPTVFHRRHSKPHRATGRDTQPQRRPLSLPRNIVSGMLRRRHGSDIQLREPPIVEVPCTAGKPRDYHARKKRAGSSFRFSHAHTTQQHSPTRGTPSLSQLPPSTAAGAVGTVGTNSNPHITIRDAGWRARFMVWMENIIPPALDSQRTPEQYPAGKPGEPSGPQRGLVRTYAEYLDSVGKPGEPSGPQTTLVRTYAEYLDSVGKPDEPSGPQTTLVRTYAQYF
ncbi:WD40-repeat-containing domain protein [Suillus clintonianus]|uniref:WD40-repeat-containing domain protein n=1 Tax=Suillus clintonianus TaxID=1904413 RepID=UPI001B87B25A|nr:WD40-repeat-containing domain protein [Suillus clintonianus]KAG2125727.1 WD40-repeat-containing domain protein [Suillus clintonianus]